MRFFTLAGFGVWTALVAGCAVDDPDGSLRASGFVEATDVRVASKIGGRLETVTAVEGARVTAGDVLVQIATTDLDLVLRRVSAERAQASAVLQLLEAGAREEDIRRAEAQVASARADRQAAQAELDAASADAERFEQLVRSRAGATKERDDAVARRNLAEARLQAGDDRVRVAEATLAALVAGARPEELAAARARIAAIDAQMAAIEHDRSEATVLAPSSGIVSSRLVEPGERVAPGAPLIVIIDLDRAWANVYVEEPLISSLRLDEAVTIVTDGGDRLEGRVAFVSPSAEFTPRNVQTADERARLVYRVKVTVDNSEGILKPGMPVEAEWSSSR